MALRAEPEAADAAQGAGISRTVVPRRAARIRTIRAFDEAYTAPHHGFRDAADYYHRASAMRVIDRISVPALIITSADDPFVPPAPFRDAAVTGNPNIIVELLDNGGHCGFIEESHGGYDGYWAERTDTAPCMRRSKSLKSSPSLVVFIPASSCVGPDGQPAETSVPTASPATIRASAPASCTLKTIIGSPLSRASAKAAVSMTARPWEIASWKVT